MKSQKEISNIEPFNDIFYKYCFYNPMLTAIYHYNGSVIPFLANEMIFYKFNESEKGFKLSHNCFPVRPEGEIMAEMGILMDIELCGENTVEKIKNAISENMPVMIPIDRFYWSSQKNNSMFYQKAHLAHYFLVIGYDDQEQLFDVINVSGTNCGKDKIDYTELVDNHEKYLARGEYGDYFVSIMKIRANRDVHGKSDFSNIRKYVSVFSRNMLERKANKFEELKHIKIAAEYYGAFENPQLQLIGEEEKLASSFFFIEKTKELELYRLSRFFPSETALIELIKMIINNYNIVLTILLKAIFNGEYGQKAAGRVVSKINQIYEQEYEYHEKLYSILEQSVGDIHE